MAQGGAAGGVAAQGGANSAGGGGSPAVPRLIKNFLLYHHAAGGSITQQLELLQAQLTKFGFSSTTTDDPAAISTTTLAQYGAVGMINNCFMPFGANGSSQAAGLKTFVEAGGSIFGTHCASVTYQRADPPHPYNQLLGGRGGGGFFNGDSTVRNSGRTWRSIS